MIVFKTIVNYPFPVIEFYKLYSHCPVTAQGGRYKIKEIHFKDEKLDLINLRTGEEKLGVNLRFAKLVLKNISYLRSTDLRVISNLALDSRGFNFSVSSAQTSYVCDSRTHRVSIDFTGGNLSVKCEKYKDAGNKDAGFDPMDVKNLPLIIAYLIKQGYDMYGLGQKNWASYSQNINLT